MATVLPQLALIIKPVKTTNSNSTNSTSLDNLLNNKTILPPISPGEIVS